MIQYRCRGAYKPSELQLHKNTFYEKTRRTVFCSIRITEPYSTETTNYSLSSEAAKWATKKSCPHRAQPVECLARAKRRKVVTSRTADRNVEQVAPLFRQFSRLPSRRRTSCSYAPDGKRCVIMGRDEAKMFSALSHQHLVTFEHVPGSITDAALVIATTLVSVTSDELVSGRF